MIIIFTKVKKKKVESKMESKEEEHFFLDISISKISNIRNQCKQKYA